MKQNILKLLLLFCITITLINCNHEEVDSIELSVTKQIKNKFTLENFDDVFVKKNLEIDWDNFNTYLNSENELISYEFNSHLKVKSSITDYAKYKLLASKNELNDWDFEIIKFSTSKENINTNLSYFSIDNFTGSIYHYNLNGENTLIKVYSKGKLIEELSVKDFVNINTFAKAPPIGNGHCLGCWTLVRTEHFTDWYTNSQGGSTLYYSHSTYDGSTTEWVYIPSSGDYYGMPYDPEDGAYHNHYDYPHSGGSTDNHDNEFVLSINDFVVEAPGDIINLNQYLNCFSNVSSSAIYSLTIYVDQPIPNQDDTWTNDGTIINPDINVGHTFISLNMNDNGNNVTQTFGFYPSSGVNPGSPQTSGAWVDDGNHPFDVSASKSLNANQFNSLITTIQSLGTPIYNLNSMNCTDAAIQICNSMGMNLTDTSGSWIGGGGSNPGNLGQDIRSINNLGVNVNSSGGFSPLSKGICN